MLLLPAVCVKELRELPCQEGVHALARIPYPPSKAQVGGRDSRFWQKPSMQRLRKATCATTADPSTPMSLPKKQVPSAGRSSLRVPVCSHFTWLLTNNCPGPEDFLHLSRRKNSKRTKTTPPSWQGQAKGDGSCCQPVLSSEILCSLQTSHFLLFPSGFPFPTPILRKSTTLSMLLKKIKSLASWQLFTCNIQIIKQGKKNTTAQLLG